MLRPSYAPSGGRPRESVFISGPLQDNEPVCSPYIEACVAAAQESCDKVPRFLLVDVARLNAHHRYMMLSVLFVQEYPIFLACLRFYRMNTFVQLMLFAIYILAHDTASDSFSH